MLDSFAGADHVIVCGLHEEGLRVVEQLGRAGVNAIVVDAEPDSQLIGDLTGLQVPYFAGDARESMTLLAVGIERAKAIVCVESDDLQTLATALQARELNPELRIVAQLRNAPVGEALSDIGVKVFDAAALAAPSIAEACIGVDSRTLKLGDHELVLAQVRCERSGTLRELFGDLAPVGVIAVDSSRVSVSPGRDTLVDEGDTAVVIGTPEAIGAVGAGRQRASESRTTFVGARAPRPQRDPRPSLLLDFINLIDTRARRALVGLLVLTALSVLVLMLGYREENGRHMSVLDALYFTVETISTVGFGDFSFRDQDSWLRLWAVFLMILGAVATTVFFALFTNLLIGRTISQALGKRSIAGLSDHVIVVGVGNIGMGVVRQLREFDSSVVVIESNSENRYVAQLAADNVPCVFGDATVVENFEAARLASARAVAVVTSDDLANLETGLIVRSQLAERWSAVPVVLRLFDGALAATVESSFDFRHIRSPAALAAPWYVGAAIGLDIVQSFYIGDLPILLARFTANGLIVGRSMIEISAQVRVVFLERVDGDAVELPRRHTTLEAGDTVHIIGTHTEIFDLVREYQLA